MSESSPGFTDDCIKLEIDTLEVRIDALATSELQRAKQLIVMSGDPLRC